MDIGEEAEAGVLSIPLIFLVGISLLPKRARFGSAVCLFLSALLLYIARMFFVNSRSDQVNAALVVGLLNALIPLSAVFAGIVFFRVMLTSRLMGGVCSVLREACGRHPAAEMMAITVGLSFIVEGLIGLGSGGVFASLLLNALGWPPSAALTAGAALAPLALMGGTSGLPIWFGLQFVPTEATDGSSMEGLLVPFDEGMEEVMIETAVKTMAVMALCSAVVPILVACQCGGLKALRQSTPFILFASLATTVPAAALCLIHSQLGILGGGIVGTGLTLTAIRLKFFLGPSFQLLEATGPALERHPSDFTDSSVHSDTLSEGRVHGGASDKSMERGARETPSTRPAASVTTPTPHSGVWEPERSPTPNLSQPLAIVHPNLTGFQPIAQGPIPEEGEEEDAEAEAGAGGDGDGDGDGDDGRVSEQDKAQSFSAPSDVIAQYMGRSNNSSEQSSPIHRRQYHQGEEEAWAEGEEEGEGDTFNLTAAPPPAPAPAAAAAGRLQEELSEESWSAPQVPPRAPIPPHAEPAGRADQHQQPEQQEEDTETPPARPFKTLMEQTLGAPPPTPPEGGKELNEKEKEKGKEDAKREGEGEAEGTGAGVGAVESLTSLMLSALPGESEDPEGRTYTQLLRDERPFSSSVWTPPDEGQARVADEEGADMDVEICRSESYPEMSSNAISDTSSEPDCWPISRAMSAISACGCDPEHGVYGYGKKKQKSPAARKAGRRSRGVGMSPLPSPSLRDVKVLEPEVPRMLPAVAARGLPDDYIIRSGVDSPQTHTHWSQFSSPEAPSLRHGNMSASTAQPTPASSLTVTPTPLADRRRAVVRKAGAKGEAMGGAEVRNARLQVDVGGEGVRRVLEEMEVKDMLAKVYGRRLPVVITQSEGRALLGLAHSHNAPHKRDNTKGPEGVNREASSASRLQSLQRERMGWGWFALILSWVMLLLMRLPQVGLDTYLKATDPHGQVSFRNFGVFRISAAIVMELEQVFRVPDAKWVYPTLALPFILPFILLAAIILAYSRKSPVSPFLHSARLFRGPALSLLFGVLFAQLFNTPTLTMRPEETPADVIGRLLGGSLAVPLAGAEEVVGLVLFAFGVLVGVGSGSVVISNLLLARLAAATATEMGLSVSSMLSMTVLGGCVGQALAAENMLAAAIAVTGRRRPVSITALADAGSGSDGADGAGAGGSAAGVAPVQPPDAFLSPKYFMTHYGPALAAYTVLICGVGLPVLGLAWT
ncbi:unnamed protein product [Vitrella brassicaformis CCMP3155]|uniref:Uncharacterized protein n=3 Tax=Vitrella brassicaformis TaxID=1169539 RepID=A0A0G4EX43_VITBC|nr:unnamed protein product [Vitrella brassicaformis CCMP3155]|eukprot:CEM02659.1 unnamed protein product [Vitrella brassicaformis CCMP3155]